MGYRPMTAHAQIASDTAFENAVWEKILEEDIESPQGVVQSICLTDEYIVCMENVSDDPNIPDIIKAYYRYDKDKDGNAVERYSLAKRVCEMPYEHCNGMAYNPNTNEIAVALYTNHIEENRGSIYLLDADTFVYKNKVKIAEDYNILGIDYDEGKDQYIIQTNADGNYSFKILDNQFQVIEDLGELSGTSLGNNFQDLCVSGDYIINMPLTLGMGIGDYINMYSLSRRALVSYSQMNFHIENLQSDEPESICELEPGVFAVVVTISYQDGRRTAGVYKTMVPYDFEVSRQAEAEPEAAKEEVAADESDENPVTVDTKETAEANDSADTVARILLKVGLLVVIALCVFVAFYMQLIRIRRERQRKLERERQKRRRIQEMYLEE